ncbi:MAG: hypothetical protein R6X19_03020 [Kiritimatiellia bacterium]
MKTALPLLCFALLAGTAAGQQNELPGRQTNLAFVAASLERDQAAASNAPHLFVRRGLLADRNAKSVRLWAEATGIQDKETEFFLISEASGHDYEALAVAFAKPGDVRDALVFIGIPPGEPVDYGACRFWPKGERVLMTFHWSPPSIGGEPVVPQAVAAEKLIINRATKAPLPAVGFVFTASRRVPEPQDPKRLALAADLFDPHSIASDYNDPDTILDVPRQAHKNAVYGWQFPNPDYRFAKGRLVEVRLQPERTDGSRRVRALTLKAAPGDGSNAPPRFSLAGLKSPALLETRDAGELLAAFQSCTNRQEDPFVSFLPDPALSLEQLRLTCAFLEMAENQGAVRLDPPPPGQLYFRAFLPEEKFRNRDNWVVKPWELELALTPAGATGTVTTIVEKWNPADSEPTLDIGTHPAPTPEALQAFLAAQKRETPVLIIHAPKNLTYGVLSRFAQAALPTHPTVWVFLK